jgi:hypothetical protein
MKKTAIQKETELRQQGYLSYDESDKTCPASHELYTAHLNDGNTKIHWCEKCKRFSVYVNAPMPVGYAETHPAINLAGINEHLQHAFTGLIY